MKKLILMALIALTAGNEAQAQTVVSFSTTDAGKDLPIEWGMDAAWDWDYNVMRGISHYGANFTTGRISFQPYNLVDASKIDDASANFGLSAGQVRKLQWRIDLIKRTGATKVNINCDHEVLTRKMDDQGNYSEELGKDNVGKANYVSTSASTYKTAEWVNLIKASVKYAQAQGLEVVSVSPFNESDYGWNQYYNGQEGTSVSNQTNYGIPTFKAIAKAIKEDSFFDGIRVCGGNTLNCDRASAWYEGLKPYIDEGNTHQLSGSFANYANFFKKVREDGNVATADEVHNVGEAMVGVEYGMQNAIWWGFDSKARGQFMHDSNEGKRIGYAEDRTHWTSAAVYRNDKDNEIHGFIGSSERQANVSTYKFQCTDRDVYFNGYGPQREWSVTTVGGASGSYQKGQINYEYLFDITYGDDVQSFAVDGNYQIMSAADKKLVTSGGAWNGNNHLAASAQVNNDTQRWHIYPGRSDGDCSYWFIDNVGDADQHWNLLNGGGAGAMSAGARVICYNANHDALEQWYLRYAKDGYFYIMARQSNKYLYNNNGTLTLQDAPTSKTSATALKRYMWRLMPTDAVAETTAPASPTGIAETDVQSTSVSFSWDAVTGEAKGVTYNVLRQDANGWNTIARCISETSFTDTSVSAGRPYNYKVQAVDYSGNRSDYSVSITVLTSGSGSSGSYTAGKWQWVGETPTASSYYIYNKTNDRFLKATSAVTATPSDATLFTLSAATGCTISYKDGTSTKYVYESSGNQSWGTTNTNTWTIQEQTNGYYVYHKDPGYRYGTRNRYITLSATTVSYGTSASATNSLLLFISAGQMAKYAKVEEYTAAFNNAAGYENSKISAELKTELVGVLEACEGTINYQNIDGYITNLNTVAAKCKAYIDALPPSAGEDFTAYIINPTIMQNGTTNDAPNGWRGATNNITGNGHWTEATGDTRLEAWHWTEALRADYYQDVVVPNGLYTLTAVTHQRENGNAALYGQTVGLIETSTKMPVGDSNEAVTTVENILVTNGSIRIGAKVSGMGNWMTADDFTLTRVSAPAGTALSHYTDAIAYLKGEAEAEMTRNPGYADLVTAYNAANSCAANVSAYEIAINNLADAILKSKKMEPAHSGDGETDFTDYIVNPTILQNGTTNDAPEGWQAADVNITGNGHWTEGTGDTRLEAWHWLADLDVNYYQDVEVPNGLYTLTAVTHQRENGNAALYGETLSLIEKNTKMPVGDGNEAETVVQNILVTDGSLRIGMKASGMGNWVTADDFTLTRVSTPAETALSHYTDAIAYLKGEAEKEMTRNPGFAELENAYREANTCAANVSAYEVAINNLAAAILKSKEQGPKEPTLPKTWIGQTGNYAGSYAERYNGDNTPYSAGRILYQVVEDLIPGAEYEIQFYAVANVARNLSAENYGDGIAYLFANDTEQDITVLYQAGCTPSDYKRTIRATADNNGEIAYGIANRKPGGQWYVAKGISIELVALPVMGDVNNSGKVTISDVTNAIKLILDEEENIPYKSDMNKDGKLDTKDIDQIVNILKTQE